MKEISGRLLLAGMATRFKLWTILLILMIYVTSSKCFVGDGCSYDHTCGKSWINDAVNCEDGHCVCRDPKHLTYDKDTGAEECDSLHPAFALGCITENCPANSSCADYWGCECNEGFFRVESECKKGYQQNVFQSCYVTNYGAIFYCNMSEHSICRSGKCVCFDKYIPNNTSGKCEHQSSYLKLHGLSEYRVKPGEYCKDDHHCISGLICRNFTCACPVACYYNSIKEVCDCGEVDTPKAPIILGVFLGFFIIIFWVWRIKETVQRFKKKKNNQRSTFSAVPHESPNNNTYNLDQILSPDLSQNSNAHAVPQAGLDVNHLSYVGRQSPVSPPRASPLPTKPAEPNSATLPETLPYSINPTGWTPDTISRARVTTVPFDYSEPPPPYSETGTFFAPPPYSIDPPPVSSSSPVHLDTVNSIDPVNCNPMPIAPYPFSPSANPIPSSPSATPIPSNLSATPIPSSPCATLNLQKTDDTPFPSNPYVAPSSPYHETGNNMAQPAYNPTYDGNRL